MEPGDLIPPTHQQGNLISGCTPTHQPRPAAQTWSCICLHNLKGKDSEGNGIESVTGCNKLKSLLLLLLAAALVARTEKENECSVLKPALITVLGRHHVQEAKWSMLKYLGFLFILC